MRIWLCNKKDEEYKPGIVLIVHRVLETYCGLKGRMPEGVPVHGWLSADTRATAGKVKQAALQSYLCSMACADVLCWCCDSSRSMTF